MFSLQLPIPAAAANLSSTREPSLFLSTCPNSCKTNSPVLSPRLAGRRRCAVSEINNENNEREMPTRVDLEVVMPKHVAVIMDGNRRWAKSKGLPGIEGHRAGEKALDQLLRNCLISGVKVLTVFAFSTENWARPQDEINLLIELFQGYYFKELESKNIMQYDVRLSFIGNRGQLPESIQNKMCEFEERTKHNKKMHLVMAINYSGRSDITKATRKIATKVKDGILQVEDVDDVLFEQHLGTNVIDEFPNPDLMIRSSGEMRVSNFSLWQLAYTEMFFTKKLFPDFDDTDFFEAITAFQRRQRRFGGHKY